MISPKKLLLAMLALVTSASAYAACAQNCEFKIVITGIRAAQPPVTTSHTYAQWGSVSNGNLSILSPVAVKWFNNDLYPAWESAMANLGKTSGKWYFEVQNGFEAGIAPASMGDNTWCPTNTYDYDYAGYYCKKGTIVAAPGTSSATIGYAVDLDDGVITIYGNNCQAMSPGIVFPPGGKTWYPVMAVDTVNGSSTNTVTANFGQSAFNCAVPSGYNAGWYN